MRVICVVAQPGVGTQMFKPLPITLQHSYRIANEAPTKEFRKQHMVLKWFSSFTLQAL